MRTGMRTPIYALLALTFVSAGSLKAGMILDSDNLNGDGLTDSDYLIPPGTTGGGANPTEAELIASIVANGGAGYEDVTDLGASFLYKFNFPGTNPASEEGSLLGSYSVEFSDNTGGTIKYNGGPSIDPGQSAWLVMKDGDIGYVIYDLTTTGSFGVGWNGVDDLGFTNNPAFFDDKGDDNPNNDGYREVSHIEIWGSVLEPEEGSHVPEPSSLLLAAFGVIALPIVARRRRQTGAEV